MKTANLTPAYGRKYNSKAAVKDSLDNNLDFILQTITDKFVGKPCNKSDLVKAGYTHAEIHYGKNLTKVTLLPL